MLPLLLQIAFGADILFSRKRALLLAIGIPTLYLWAVDAVAIAAGTWIIDPQQTTGLKLGPLPVEEMLFFAVTNIIVAGGITLVCAPEGQQRAKKLFTRWSGANRKPFPGPTSFELLRSLPAIQANPMQYLEQVTRQYGDVVGIQAGPIRAVVVNDREAIKHILQDNHRNYTKDTIQYNSLAAITGRGLLTSDGDFWFRQRRQLQPAFIRRNLVNYAPAIDTAIAHMLVRWQPYADNDLVLDVDAEMMVTTLEIVGQALFSVDLSQKAPALTKAVITCLDHIMYRARHITALPNSFPTARNLRFKKALAVLDEEVANIINQRRASAPRQDMLGALIKNLDESGEKGMTPAQLRDEIITILIAGHETVASALTWNCYLLSQNPAILKKMRSELDQVLGGRLPGMSDLPDLTYTRMVFEETLRLYPPAWLITRKASEDDEIAAGVIPAGALVIIGVSAVHHHPAYWPDPDTFDPERFAPEHSADNPLYAYLPFGGGRRLCIGNNFALAEAPLILASIYQRYRLDVLPGHKVEPEPLVTIRPRNGLPMTLHNA
jgi:lycopene cyclase domain-containing protein